MAESLTATMDALMACVQTRLADGDRPACTYGKTIGLPAPGPAGCCDGCNNGAGGQVSAFLERTYPVNGVDFEQVALPANCRPTATAADISIVVLRCYPSLDEQGNMPSLDDTSPFADNLNTDLSAVWDALTCCEGFKLAVREAAIDADPEGGCSGFAVRVSVLVRL